MALLTVAEVAERLRVSPASVYQGGAIRIPEAMLERMGV